jgi:hypothetical protein
MEIFDYDLDDVYQDVKEKALAEGAFSHEAWKSMVDAVLADRNEFGEIHDEDLQEIKELLIGRFADFEAETRERK